MSENSYLGVRCCMILYTVEKGSEKQAWCLPNNSQYQIPSSQNQWEPLEATGHLCSNTQDQMCMELNFSWNPRKPHFIPFLELVRSWTCSSLSSLWVLFQLLSNSRSKQKRSNCLQRLRKLRHEVLPSEAELHFPPLCSLLPFPHCSWLPPLISGLPHNTLGYKMLFITFFQ